MDGRLLAILLMVWTGKALCQPLLPELSVTHAAGVVQLAWACPYTNVKAVQIYRADDTNAHYEKIGTTTTAKGVQQYQDRKATEGTNCYRVELTFSTGLKWRSNTRCISVPKTQRESDMKLERDPKPLPRPVQVARSVSPTKPVSMAQGGMPQPVGQAIRYRAPAADTNDRPYLEVRSGVVTEDVATGMLRIEVVGDLLQHHFSLRFYAEDGKSANTRERRAAVEIPRINASPMLLDKRNFERQGWYEFVLRKDAVVLETGYLYVGR